MCNERGRIDEYCCLTRKPYQKSKNMLELFHRDRLSKDWGAVLNFNLQNIYCQKGQLKSGAHNYYPSIWQFRNEEICINDKLPLNKRKKEPIFVEILYKFNSNPYMKIAHSCLINSIKQYEGEKLTTSQVSRHHLHWVKRIQKIVRRN